MFFDDRYVVVHTPEQAFPAPATTEQECAEGRRARTAPAGREEIVQILMRRSGVAHLELNGLALLHDIPDHDGTRFLIGADQIADEKISPLEASAMFVDGDADMQRPMRQFPLLGLQ